MDAQNRRTIAVNEQLIGFAVEVLAEGAQLAECGPVGGPHARIKSPRPRRRPTALGDLIQVRVERATPQALYAGRQVRVPKACNVWNVARILAFNRFQAIHGDPRNAPPPPAAGKSACFRR